MNNTDIFRAPKIARAILMVHVHPTHIFFFLNKTQKTIVKNATAAHAILANVFYILIPQYDFI